MGDIELVIKISEEEYINIKEAIDDLTENGLERDQLSKVCLAILEGKPLPKGHGRIGDLDALLDKIKSEIEQLPVNTRTNWDGCLPDIEYPEIEYVDVKKARLLEIIDKYQSNSDTNNNGKGNNHKCEAECKTCETCSYKNEGYISGPCLTCCKYYRERLQWKPKENEVEE